MENKLFDYDKVKERFALLIAKLHDAGLPIDYINQVIVKSPFFDCFEKNDLNEFMTMSFETITEKIFGKEVVYDYSKEFINPYYWAGLEVMDVMANLEVPLKRILLIMPLKEIIGCFDVYHEMHHSQFLNHYQHIENSRNVLRVLRDDAGYSNSKISYLTGIKQSLLNIMDRTNATLFGTSFSNLTKLSQLFDVSIDVFKKKTSYLPYSDVLLKSKTFEPIFVKNILQYFNFDEADAFTISERYIEDKESRALLVNNKVIVSLSDPFGVIYVSSNRINRKYLAKEEFFFLYKKSLDELRIQVSEQIH